MNFTSRARAAGLLTVAVAIVAVVVVNAQKEQRTDLLPAFSFKVELDGEPAGHFREVSGLKIEVDVIEFQEGGSTGPIHKLPGATRYANIRLSRAFTGDRSLYARFVGNQRPNPIKFDGRIVMFNRQGTLVAEWKFVNGIIVKWEGPDFDASKNEIAIETIEIAHEGLTLADAQN